MRIELNTLDGIKQASLNFTTGALLFDIQEGYDEKQVKELMKKTILSMEDEVVIEETETKAVKKASDGVKQQLVPIVIGAILLILGIVFRENNVLSLVFYLTAYLITGWKVLGKQLKIFGAERFLMKIS